MGLAERGKDFSSKHECPEALVFNLLKADDFQRLSARPTLIRETLAARPRDLVVVDEIQKLPQLMDEIHFMIEETGQRFVLTGSSARKLKRSHTSLMAGRAKSLRLHPFVSKELPLLDLDKALLHGLLPPVYLSGDPAGEIKDYVGNYLQEEIMAEALSRNIENFSRFLHRAALSNGEVINFESIARDAQALGAAAGWPC